MARRKSQLQDLPSTYGKDFQDLIVWAEDLGRVARLSGKKPNYKKIPRHLHTYTFSAYQGIIAEVETAEMAA